MINGIIGFMLTPGDWLQTRDFWDGIFNPSFWPSLAFRSAMCVMLAGLFAFVTTPRIQEAKTRERMMRYAARWVAYPFPVLLAAGYWDILALPEAQRAMILGTSPETLPMLRAFLVLSLALATGGIVLAWMLPNRLRPVLVGLLLVLGLMHMGAFEWTREAGRKPWLIHGVLYSNSLEPARLAESREKGFLASAKWTEVKEVNGDNRLQSGKSLFSAQCIACHSVNGPMKDILPLTAKHSVFGLEAQLDGQGKLLDYMPPFFGNRQEREALAAYIVEELHGKKPEADAYQAVELTYDMPPSDGDSAEYILLAWNNLGMHCISDSDPWWVLLPPANDIFAQLVRRGDIPEIVTEGIRLEYAVEPGFENPSAHVRFWEFSKSLFGADLAPNVGLAGKGLKGEMEHKENLRAFAAELIPVVPYPDNGGFNPYPLFTITAYDEATGAKLAETKTVAPTSTEMGCRNCHGGDWRVAGAAGFTDFTSADVLAVHDKNTGTKLTDEAEAGKPRLCQSCHSDPVLGTTGQPDLLCFPAAIHGWHANYLTGRGTEACYACHPARASGPTGCLRGVHADRGLDCTNCHGYLEDHALSLLTMEDSKGKKGAQRLMKHLEPRTVASVGEVVPRTPWLMEPDCASCHDFENKPDPQGGAFNKWTSGEPGDLYRLRLDDAGALMCEACHGSTHAVYPARDNIQPLQYQGEAGPIGMAGNCGVCHTAEVEYPVHHPIIQ